jgi:hypothetical protein
MVDRQLALWVEQAGPRGQLRLFSWQGSVHELEPGAWALSLGDEADLYLNEQAGPGLEEARPQASFEDQAQLVELAARIETVRAYWAEHTQALATEPEPTESDLWDDDEELAHIVRASGDCICESCGWEYWRHPSAMDHLGYDGQPFLRRLCDRTLVKL